MALHLNLYHEITQQKVSRRRDPLKLGMYGLVLIAVFLAAYFFFCLTSVRLSREELKRLSAKWEELSSQEKVAAEREKELVGKRGVVESLRNSINTRFLWASFLQDFGESVPRNVQITRMVADVTADNQLIISIEGIAAGMQPRSEAESFRVTLGKVFGKRYSQADSTFRSLEDVTDQVVLDGKQLETASFSIRLAVDATGGPITEMPDQRFTLAVPAQP